MTDHQKDSDCTVDPETNLCTICGVDHSEPCPDCNGRGFHALTCPQVLSVLDEAQLPGRQ